MQQLSTIIQDLHILRYAGSREVEVAALAFDSRKVEQDGLFVAVPGTKVDGHAYIGAALEQGAKVIVAERLPEDLQQDKVYIQVENAAQALAQMATAFYGHPSHNMTVVGITGTNGKTSVATMLFTLFTRLGHECGLISTVVNRIGEQAIAATHTTPDPIQIQQLMAEMVQKGVTHCFMEVSSHALVQQRVVGVDFNGTLFTNISRDHLDYHKTFDRYIAAKKLLFDGLSPAAFALYNADDKRGHIMVQNCQAQHYSFALKTPADFKARLLSNTLEGLELEMDNRQALFPLKGVFNAYNLTSVYATAVLLGEDAEQVLIDLSAIPAPPGRFQTVSGPNKQFAVIDYAHTPDALMNVLSTLKEIRTRNESLVTVFGCGGDRDKGKRPEMGRVAASYSDRIVLTSDNPRSEDPLQIIQEIQRGVEPHDFKKVRIQPDRKLAIEETLQESDAGDIILIAGKGHEDYQEIKGERLPFSDLETVRSIFKQMPA